nr:hypothetical protein [Desulfobacteraceae bacterium]
IYDGIIVKKNFLFSPDSNRFFYVAYKNKACVAVIDSKEESSSYKLIENAIFSPDSNHYAYKARVERRGIKETWQVVQDGNPQTIYDKIFDIVFSSDSQHLAYAAVKDQKMVMVVDGEEINKSDIIGMPVFSLDSKIFAYACAKNDSWFIIVNDEKSPSFDQVYKFIFSLDSKRYSFIAKDGSEWFCNVDGQNGPGFDKSIDAFKFSSDSSRFAYVGINSEGSRVITEAGPLSETYFSVGEPYFSPDNRHFVFRAKKDKSSKWLIIIDGKKKYKPYHAIGKYYFSPDSRHIAAPVFHNINQTFMMVDGNEQCADTKFKILDTPYFSPDGNYVVYYGMKDDKDWHLIVNGVVLPNTYGGFFKGTPIIFDTSSSFHTLSLTEPGPEFISIDVDIPKSFPPLESGF